jgi:hypothetical protein
VHGQMVQISGRAASPQSRVPVAWSLSQMAGVDVKRTVVVDGNLRCGSRPRSAPYRDRAPLF